ncbi:CRY2 [Symbiodinium sp. CCMP2592]|nr:CRY2 [Symbiodinium sp. CCMP2592]
MTEDMNPVSLDMPIFGDAAWEERHASSAAGSSSACPAPAVAPTQMDPTQMDMDSSQETSLNPEPPALGGAVFETPPRSRQLSVAEMTTEAQDTIPAVFETPPRTRQLSLEELQTPEGKVRLRETPESGDARSSEIRGVLRALAVTSSPAASPVACTDPYLHAGITAEASVDDQSAEIPVEQFQDKAIHTLSELPDETGHLLALVYQLCLCETEQKGVLLKKGVLSSIVENIILGYKNHFDRARLDNNRLKLNEWMRKRWPVSSGSSDRVWMALWSILLFCTPPADLETWATRFQQLSRTDRAAKIWDSLNHHICELLGSNRFCSLSNKLDEAAQSLVAWANATDSPGLGFVHVLIFDRYIKVGKTSVLLQSKSGQREPNLIPRLRNYMIHARLQNATLVYAPIVLVATSPYKSDLVESFIMLYPPETYSVEALHIVMNSVKFAATRTVQQLLSGKNSLVQLRYLQSRGRPIAKEELNDSLRILFFFVYNAEPDKQIHLYLHQCLDVVRVY